MSDRGLWDDNLQLLQQQYWERWSELRRRAEEAAPSRKNPWEMALEHWWQAVAPAVPENAAEFMTRMMDQGRQLFQLAERFAGSGGPGGDPSDWNEVLNRLAAEMDSADGAKTDDQSRQKLHNVMGFWELPFNTWQRIASMLSILPGDLFRNIHHGTSEATPERLLSVPGLGISREEQAQLQTLLRLIHEYHQVLQRYSGFFSSIGSESVERLREKLAQMAANGEVIESARALYDIWVATCEAVYGKRVTTAEYAHINGQLVNASMRVKHQVGIMLDDKLVSLNMPTRREVRTLQARVQENRRENRRLRAELVQLKGRLDDLQGAIPPPGERAAAPRSRRKAVPRKKSAAASPGSRSRNTNQ